VIYGSGKCIGTSRFQDTSSAQTSRPLRRQRNSGVNELSATTRIRIRHGADGGLTQRKQKSLIDVKMYRFYNIVIKHVA